MPPEIAGQAVLVALASNALGRLILAVSAGPAVYWIPLTAATLLAAVTGYATFALVPSF